MTVLILALELWLLASIIWIGVVAYKHINAQDDRIVELEDAIDELLECANLRGDNDLPHPENDAKLWTARMQDAWDHVAAVRDEEMES